MSKTRKWATLAASAIAIGMVAFLVGHAWAGGIPATGALTYSGRLEDAAGAPLTGDHPIQINLWNAATPGTTPLCLTQPTPYTLTGGRFSVPLPDTCTDAIKGNVDVWVEVAVDGVSLGTTKLGAVPYAVEAGHAVSANAAAGDLDTRINALEKTPTYLESTSKALELGSLSGDLIYQSVSVSLTPGTWLVQAFGTLFSKVNPDGVQIGLWNDTTSAEVPNSRSPVGQSDPWPTGGTTCSSSASQCDIVPLTTAAVVTVGSATTIKIKASPHGTSQVGMGGPSNFPYSNRISALQVR